MELSEFIEIRELADSLDREPNDREILLELTSKSTSLGEPFADTLYCLAHAERINTLPMDRKGHDTTLPVGVYQNLLSARSNLAQALRGFLQGTPHTPHTPDKSREQCWHCGERVFFVFQDGMFVVQSECEYRDGVAQSYTLSAPSGQVVVKDDLRAYFPKLDESAILKPCTRRWQDEISKAYEKLGMVHMFVGQSYPWLIRTETDKYILAVLPPEDVTLPAGWQQLTQINTELWWVSLADMSAITHHTDNLSPIPFTPGNYTVTHKLYSEEEHLQGFLVLATIELQA